MKSFARTVKIVAVMFIVLFTVNMALLYLFFDVNALNPLPRQVISGNSGQDDLKAALERRVSRDDSGPKQQADPDTGNGQNRETPAPLPSPDEAKSDQDKQDADLYMTADEVACLSELGLSEKLTALSIITKLGTEEADTIYNLAADGVTMEEMEQIETILRRRLTEEDIRTIVGILEQYKKSHAKQSALHD